MNLKSIQVIPEDDRPVDVLKFLPKVFLVAWDSSYDGKEFLEALDELNDGKSFYFIYQPVPESRNLVSAFTGFIENFIQLHSIRRLPVGTGITQYQTDLFYNNGYSVLKPFMSIINQFVPKELAKSLLIEEGVNYGLSGTYDLLKLLYWCRRIEEHFNYTICSYEDVHRYMSILNDTIYQEMPSIAKKGFTLVLNEKPEGTAIDLMVKISPFNRLLIDALQAPRFYDKLLEEEIYAFNNPINRP